jgi:SAM-dependent methyltransferase
LRITEKIILDSIRDEITNKKILDIGVGSGRTIPYFSEISNDYIGIDYSPEMVNFCKKKFPLINILRCDARDMKDFADEYFDAIMFPFNGIDYVIHNDRIKIFAEIFRTLKENGLFIFSTHNRKAFKRERHLPVNLLKPQVNYLLIPKRIISFILGSINHYKNRQHEIFTDDYSLINDLCNTFSVLTYFVESIDVQIKQLRAIGFNNEIKAFNMYGEVVESDNESEWIYFLVRK